MKNLYRVRYKSKIINSSFTFNSYKTYIGAWLGKLILKSLFTFTCAGKENKVWITTIK